MFRTAPQLTEHLEEYNGWAKKTKKIKEHLARDSIMRYACRESWQLYSSSWTAGIFVLMNATARFYCW